MEIQIKKTIRAGNSSAVTLPRAWLNQEVRVELIKKTKETILSEVIFLLNKYLDLKEVVGIYLVGSYARGEEDKSSDIDILVITENIDREIIKEGLYNILLVSEDLLSYKLKKDIFPIGPMIKEAMPLINAKYLRALEVKVNKSNVKWYLETTKEKLDLINKVLCLVGDQKKPLSDTIAYTLILRIRTLEIIKRLIIKEAYSKKDFLRMIKSISGNDNAYGAYLSIKNNSGDEKITTFKEVKKLYEYLKKQLAVINEKVSNLPN